MSDFESSQRIGWPMWILSAVAAVAIHVAGIALAGEYLRDDDPDPEFGARAIEIGIELTARRLEPTDLPPGPDVEQSISSPPAVEQTKIEEPAVVPRETPIEAPDPKLVVAPVETKKPSEDKPLTPTALANPSVPTISVEATARPTSTTIKDSTRSITPEQGTGESPQRVRGTWQKELIAHLDRHKRYPATASLQGAEILVNFVIDESGHVVSSAVVRGSGDASFDEAALAMIQRSDPVPKPPAPVVEQGLSFTLPVIFRIRHVN
jgi:periplasmic protein TonB